MRNDANDELDDVPSLSVGTREEQEYVAVTPRHTAAPDVPVQRAAAPVKAASTGPLWALVGALMIAFAGLAWWSFQQISLMEQQLVATQESFARISEEAAGRIKDISGKVVATESSVTSGSEALKLQVKQLEGKLAELNKQQLGSSGQQGNLDKRLEQVSSELKAQQDANAELSKTLTALAAEQTTLAGTQTELKSSVAEQAKLAGQFKDLNTDVQALKKVENPTRAINDLQDELLVLKSTLDNRPAPKSNTAEFDAFRAQVTRTTSTLQSQIRNLQDQIDAK